MCVFVYLVGCSCCCVGGVLCVLLFVGCFFCCCVDLFLYVFVFCYFEIPFVGHPIADLFLCWGVVKQ